MKKFTKVSLLAAALVTTCMLSGCFFVPVPWHHSAVPNHAESARA